MVYRSYELLPSRLASQLAELDVSLLDVHPQLTHIHSTTPDCLYTVY